MRERDCVKIEKIVKLGLNAGGALGVYIHDSVTVPSVNTTYRDTCSSLLPASHLCDQSLLKEKHYRYFLFCDTI